MLRRGLLPIMLLLLTTPVGGAESPPRPRLAVVIVVDQFRGDYLVRYGPYFGDDGFRRLMDGGAWFVNGEVTYGTSATGPGHATIATGCLPRAHGVVGNEWYNDAAGQKDIAAVYDPDTTLVGAADGKRRTGCSPRAMIGAGLGDALKLADRRSRVFSVAVKDRAAVFLGGHAADGAYWFDKASGNAVTSTYYRSEMPGYLAAFNDSRPLDAYAGRRWEACLPEEAYAGTYPLQAAWLPTLRVLGPQFPHVLPNPTKPDKQFYDLVFHTPYGNEVVLQAARQIVEHERLGADAAPDLLCVGLSANDYAGHVFGPQSAEVLDLAVRTDRELAAWFTWLDERIGRGNYVIALTADHGVSPAPHISRQLGLPVDYIDLDHVVAVAIAQVAIEFPELHEIKPLGVNLPWVYLPSAFDRLDERNDGRVSRALVRELRRQPGLAAAFTEAELAGPAPSAEDRLRGLAWRSYHPGRSGQLYLQLSPGWFMRGGNLAGHTAGFRSDRHVPLLFWGPGVLPGRHEVGGHLIDIAPTLSALLGIEPPGDAAGAVLPILPPRGREP